MKNFDERIAVFMNLQKKSGMWNHPTEFAICSELCFNYDWSWLMPVVTKIQSEYRLHLCFREFENNGWGISCSVMIFGQSSRCYYWCDYDSIKNELEKNKKEAAKYNEVYEDESHIIVENKFEAVYKGVCYFIEWWEKQDRKIIP